MLKLCKVIDYKCVAEKAGKLIGVKAEEKKKYIFGVSNVSLSSSLDHLRIKL